MDAPTDTPASEPPPSRGPLPVLRIGPGLSAKLSNVTLLAVVAVVVWHSGNLTNRFLPGHYGRIPDAPRAAVAVEWLVSTLLTRWSISLLFALSGFLLARDLVPTVRSFATKYRRRARTLLVPFLAWSAIGVALHVLEGVLDLPARFTDPSVARSLERLDVIEKWLHYPITYPLWFLQALLVCVLVSPILYVLVDRLGYLGLAPLAALWAFTRHGHGQYYDPMALTYFALGMLVALRLRAGRWVPLSRANDTRRRIAAVLPWLFVAACVAHGLTLRLDRTWWARLLLELLTALGVAAVWFGYDVYLKRWASAAVVVALAPLSFFLFVAQEPFLHLYKRLFLVLTGGSGNGAEAVLVSWALTIVATIVTVTLLGAILRAVLPGVFGFLTGGRGLPAGGTTSATRSTAPAPGTDA